MSDVKALNINGSSYDIKAFSIVDQNDGRLRYWTGTREEYQELKDNDALEDGVIYNVEEDTTDIPLSVVQVLYPVGALYIGGGSMEACPLQVLGIGTWLLINNAQLVIGLDNEVPVVGNGLGLGLTNGSTDYTMCTTSQNSYGVLSKCELIGAPLDTQSSTFDGSNNRVWGISRNAQNSGIVADLSNSTTSLDVKIWKRVS